MNRSALRWMSVAVFISMLPLAGASAAPPLLETSFETDPIEAGWSFVHVSSLARTQRAGQWTDSEARTGERSIRAIDGVCRSPALPVEPFEFYRLRFFSKTSTQGYWFIRFFDERGGQIPADNYSSVFESKDWCGNEFYVMGRPGAVSARVGFHATDAPLYVDDLSFGRADRRRVVEWADALYKTLPPIRYQPARGRWKFLTRTMAKLRAGRPLRVVLLGDSIANDLGNSHFHLLIERAYPGARITLIPSVRGMTGCGWYQRRGRVRQYVIDYKPDLLIIAGVSHRFDTQAIRSVVRQVREKISPEILVTTGALSDPRGKAKSPPWLRFATREQARERLARFYADVAAAGEKDRFATLDVRGLWESYLDRSPRPAQWYRRDEVHGNARGKQIMGRLVARFFEPD